MVLRWFPTIQLVLELLAHNRMLDYHNNRQIKGVILEGRKEGSNTWNAFVSRLSDKMQIVTNLLTFAYFNVKTDPKTDS